MTATRRSFTDNTALTAAARDAQFTEIIQRQYDETILTRKYTVVAWWLGSRAEKNL